MEKQFQEVYTYEIFKWVRIEFFGRQGCIVKEVVRGGKEVKYKIQDEAKTMRLFEVRFSSIHAWLIVYVACLSLEAYYVGMPYFCFPRNV